MQKRDGGTDTRTVRGMELGLFEIKESTINHPDGHVTVTKTPKITGKGQVYFINRYIGNAMLPTIPCLDKLEQTDSQEEAIYPQTKKVRNN